MEEDSEPLGRPGRVCRRGALKCLKDGGGEEEEEEEEEEEGSPSEVGKNWRGYKLVAAWPKGAASVLDTRKHSIDTIDSADSISPRLSLRHLETGGQFSSGRCGALRSVTGSAQTSTISCSACSLNLRHPFFFFWWHPSAPPGISD